MLKGMEVLAEAVGSTLGPKGQCVVIDDYIDDKPLVTKDGITVARNIQLKDKFENVGCELLKEASLRTSDLVGDATTTTVVLANELVHNATKLINKGYNPIQIKNEIQKIYENVVQAIKDQSIPTTDETLEMVARISSNNDAEIGRLIAEAFRKIGKDGVITVEESSSVRTYTDTVNGMQFDRGYESPHFATDPIKGHCELEKPLVLLTDRKIQLMKEIVPILEYANKHNRAILIIATDYDNEVIQNLKINKSRGILQVCAIKAPSYGEYRKKLLEDLAILTGGKVVTYESGLDLQKCDENILGSCNKAIITRDNTTIIGGNGDKGIINARCEQIREEIRNPMDSMDKTFLEEFNALRLARLVGGVSTIYVGGTTELEMRERKDRIDDAVCATKAAIEEGIVPGGGVSFIMARDKVLRTIDHIPSESEMIVLNALFAIEDKIILNCGVNRQDVESIHSNDEAEGFPNNWGFDANNMKWVNMLNAGIINPAKADRCAFENAFSILNLYLTANTLIVNEEITF